MRYSPTRVIHTATSPTLGEVTVEVENEHARQLKLYAVKSGSQILRYTRTKLAAMTFLRRHLKWASTYKGN